MDTGDAFVSAWTEAGDSQIVRIDSVNQSSTGHMFLPRNSVPRAVFVEQTFNGILPFHFEVVSAGDDIDQLGFGYEGVSLTEEFNTDLFSPEGGYDELLHSAHEAELDVLIWYRGDSGIMGTREGVGRTFDAASDRDPDLVTRLPVFSWDSTQYMAKPSMIISDSGGGLHRIVYNQSEETIEESVAKDGKLLPFGEQQILGISSVDNETDLFIYTDTYLGIIDGDSVEPVAAMEVSEELNVTSQYPRGKAWGVIPSEGNIFTGEIDN